MPIETVRRLVVVAVAATALAFPAAAHDLEPSHEARVVVGPVADGGREARAILSMTLPPDARAQALAARFDLNGSGSLEPAEGRLLADAVGPEVVGGFVLTVGERAATPIAAEGTASLDGEGRLRVVLVLTYRLDADVDSVGVTILERPARGRAASRPMRTGIEVVEGEASNLWLPPMWTAPGERTPQVTLRAGENESAGVAQP
jgi:hypothetical protein